MPRARQEPRRLRKAQKYESCLARALPRRGALGPHKFCRKTCAEPAGRRSRRPTCRSSLPSQTVGRHLPQDTAAPSSWEPAGTRRPPSMWRAGGRGGPRFWPLLTPPAVSRTCPFGPHGLHDPASPCGSQQGVCFSSVAPSFVIHVQVTKNYITQTERPSGKSS